MKPVCRLLSLSLLAALPLLAGAQSYWKWRDANGVMQISDRPPPASVPDKAIISRPGAQPIVQSAPAEPASAASAAQGDKELEAKRKQLAAAQAASDAARKADEATRTAARKADTCQRARGQVAMLESGVRVVRPNAQGEREFLDDQARADEVRRAREAIAANCQ